MNSKSHQYKIPKLKHSENKIWSGGEGENRIEWERDGEGDGETCNIRSHNLTYL